MKRGLLLALLALAGCTVEGSYSSDPFNTSGYPCRLQVVGKAVRIHSLDMECTGADPAAGGNFVPAVSP